MSDSQAEGPTDKGRVGKKSTTLVSLDSLQRQFNELNNTAQQLLTEKLFLENECNQLKKKANRLDEEIRKIIYKNEWWFSVVDVVQALTNQFDDYTARKYWNKLAQRLREEGSEVVTNCHRLKLLAQDGKMRETDCANTEGIFRIIQN